MNSPSISVLWKRSIEAVLLIVIMEFSTTLMNQISRSKNSLLNSNRLNPIF
ncbi:hypothetical protein LEP1GSC021_3174 [Leptospira noguchii str. 1993005606]|nr:hypothetical protein LEP1GSC021_3174 [Leptospira noguchii str. 1993005606]